MADKAQIASNSSKTSIESSLLDKGKEVEAVAVRLSTDAWAQIKSAAQYAEEYPKDVLQNAAKIGTTVVQDTVITFASGQALYKLGRKLGYDHLLPSVFAEDKGLYDQQAKYSDRYDAATNSNISDNGTRRILRHEKDPKILRALARNENVAPKFIPQLVDKVKDLRSEQAEYLHEVGKLWRSHPDLNPKIQAAYLKQVTALKSEYQLQHMQSVASHPNLGPSVREQYVKRAMSLDPSIRQQALDALPPGDNPISSFSLRQIIFGKTVIRPLSDFLEPGQLTYGVLNTRQVRTSPMTEVKPASASLQGQSADGVGFGGTNFAPAQNGAEVLNYDWVKRKWAEIRRSSDSDRATEMSTSLPTKMSQALNDSSSTGNQTIETVKQTPSPVDPTSKPFVDVPVSTSELTLFSKVTKQLAPVANVLGPFALAAPTVVEGVFDGYEEYNKSGSVLATAEATTKGAGLGLVNTYLPSALNGYNDVFGGGDKTVLDRTLNAASDATGTLTTIGATAIVIESAGIVSLPAAVPTAFATGVTGLSNFGVNALKGIVKVTGLAGRDQDGGYIYDGAKYAVDGVEHLLGFSD